MTEADWLAATDPAPMLEFLRGKASERKLRLFAVACCRQVWDLITEPVLRDGVEISERFADGDVTSKELSATYKRAKRALAKIDAAELAAQQRYYAAVERAIATGVGEIPCLDHGIDDAARAAQTTTLKSIELVLFAAESARRAVEMREISTPNQAELLRDLFGNPFAPPALDPVWLTSTVLALAQGIYDGKTFDRLPILADALADAGCESDDLLSHCRGDGPHVRGCWAVDLILGKV